MSNLSRTKDETMSPLDDYDPMTHDELMVDVRHHINRLMNTVGDAMSLLSARDREIEALKAEIRRLNEQLVAQARSNDNPRSQLIAVFEEVAETLKAKTPKPLVGTCDGDLEP